MYQNINEILKDRLKSYCDKECPVRSWYDCADEDSKGYLHENYCYECLVENFVKTITE